ncbi:MAG: 2,3-bisphosphoglycerate-independent phosphoglycerate mutase [Planctomycetota bacterium]|nr:2,3-bisphosphoglycerate-independent phosphoglycerate mutase [Planctomycetota bacterium]
MDLHQLTRELNSKNDSKIVLLVADGLGGLPMEPGGLTELETAKTPNLDALCQRGVCGGSIPIKPGIAPGSGPGHLGLFGYDPLQYVIGRGALEATGIGFELGPKDVAIRGNYCTLDAAGKISDRRAGRIPSEESAPLAVRLRQVKIPGIEVFVEPVKEHRFVVVLRGEGLGGDVHDTDPQKTGVPPLAPRAVNAASQKTADAAAEFIRQATKLLAGEKKANGLTLRGFSAKPALPSYEEVYGLKAAAIAVYPMYKGLARLVGMDIVGKAQTLTEQMEVLKENWDKYDFFFIHFKYTDSTGEDGNFSEKVKRIEELDAAVPAITALGPTVFIVTGDHSTPSFLKSHSWHPVPTLLVSDCCRYDGTKTFGERDCLRGGLGIFEAKYLMPLALSNAGRMGKYGA